MVLLPTSAVLLAPGAVADHGVVGVAGHRGRGPREASLVRGVQAGCGRHRAVELATNILEVSHCPKYAPFNKEKVLLGALSGHCATSRRFVGSSTGQWDTILLFSMVRLLGCSRWRPRAYTD